VSDIRQEDFDAPLGNLVLRDGRSFPIRRADYGTFELVTEMQREPDNAAKQYAVIKRMLDGIDDEAIRSLTPEVVTAVMVRSQSGIQEAYELLGESSGTSPGQRTSDSSPTDPAATSAPESPPTTG
jgi:hypothetical protein